jgi:hypothetical protein
MEKETILTPKVKDKIDKLPYLFKVASYNLVNALDNILNGECDEGEIASVLTTMVNNTSQSYSKEDLVNYDKAGDILGIRNRANLQSVLKEHNIEQVVMNNRKVGFPRNKVIALRDELYK